ncbi:MAG: methyltransferase [Propionibacterium sp.]|nr:methyltransferase [Propionibacterium sp.]
MNREPIERAEALAPDDVRDLRARLLAAGYTLDAVLERIGEAGQSGLLRNSTVPAEVAIAGVADPQATLIRLWLLQLRVSEVAAAHALDLSPLLDAGILRRDGDMIRAGVDIRPYGGDQPVRGESDSGWVVSDLAPGMNQVTTPTRPDYVLGVSPASTSLAQLTARRPVGSALDLGTGCGVQALHLGRHARRVVGTDVNRRALRLAALTAALNDADIDLREGSLYGPVEGERFDLIVTNPPYVMSPPTTDAARLTYREGTFGGDGLVRAVVEQAPAHLTDGGMLQVLGNWAMVDAVPWQERLASWVEGTGCDLWVVERERLDIYDYIEIWLTDAGLAGSPLWRPRYDQWLDYFSGLGITGVGMGWLTLTNAHRDQPDIEVESWPHAVEQPVGPVIARRSNAVTAATLAVGDLLQGRWRLDGSVSEETIGEPGAADPAHVVLRSDTGLRRAIKVSTLTGGVLGACDGELSLGGIIGAVASLLSVPVAEAIAETVPLVRRALREGLLVDAGA